MNERVTEADDLVLMVHCLQRRAQAERDKKLSHHQKGKQRMLKVCSFSISNPGRTQGKERLPRCLVQVVPWSPAGPLDKTISCKP